MRTKLNLILVAIFAITFSLQAQDETLDELKAMMAEKQGIADGIGAEIADLDARIKAFPGWSKGLGGTVGFNLSGTNNWFADDVIKTAARGFGLSLAGYANNNADDGKYFWNNSLNVSVTSGNSRADNDIDGRFTTEGEDLDTKASLFTINSLAGYQLFSKIYASGAASYNTTVFSFNNPGKLSFSLGLTWKPINDLVIYVHPLAYQWTFPTGDFAAAAGAVIGATYSAEIVPGVKWTSSLDAFSAYGDNDEKGFTRSQLSNWTWMNGFSVADVFKGIGLGFNIGLRKDEVLGIAKNSTDAGTIQTIYNLGLSYAL